MNVDELISLLLQQDSSMEVKYWEQSHNTMDNPVEEVTVYEGYVLIA